MNSFTSDKLAQIFMSLEMYGGMHAITYLYFVEFIQCIRMFTLLIIIHVFHILMKYVFAIVQSI